MVLQTVVVLQKKLKGNFSRIVLSGGQGDSTHDRAVPMMYNLRRRDALARGGGRGYYSTFERSKSPAPARRRSSASAPASPLGRLQQKPSSQRGTPIWPRNKNATRSRTSSRRKRSICLHRAGVFALGPPQAAPATYVDKDTYVDKVRRKGVTTGPALYGEYPPRAKKTDHNVPFLASLMQGVELNHQDAMIAGTRDLRGITYSKLNATASVGGSLGDHSHGCVQGLPERVLSGRMEMPSKLNRFFVDEAGDAEAVVEFRVRGSTWSPEDYPYKAKWHQDGQLGLQES
jgi:hypothetical protein